MKFLSLVVVLVFIHCCAAQTNRSSVWLLANTQIFRTGSQTPQNCFVTAAGATATSSIPLFTTSNLAITGTFIQLGQKGAAAFVTSNSILYTVSVQFIYNSTYSITLAIPAQTLNTLTPTALTVSTLSLPPATTWWTSTVGGSTSTVYPVLTSGNMVLTPTGTTWLRFQDVPAIYTASAVATNVAAASSGLVITDYISSSTIFISLWNDNNAAALIATLTGAYNPIYQIGVRTKTSTISSSSSLLTNAGSCATTGRKRSVDHLINKRQSAVCTSASSIDPSMTSSILSTACTNIGTVATGTAAAATTSSNLQDAFNRGVTAMNALYQADFAVFGAGSSKFAIASNFGMLIALSSIIFSFLN